MTNSDKRQRKEKIIFECLTYSYSLLLPFKKNLLVILLWIEKLKNYLIRQKVWKEFSCTVKLQTFLLSHKCREWAQLIITIANHDTMFQNNSIILIYYYDKFIMFFCAQVVRKTSNPITNFIILSSHYCSDSQSLLRGPSVVREINLSGLPTLVVVSKFNGSLQHSVSTFCRMQFQSLCKSNFSTSRSTKIF
jgi:hypothetical protein